MTTGSALRRGLVCMVLAAVSVSIGALTTSTARAQSCVQPAVEGCLLEPGQPVSAALTRPDDAHFWWLTLPATATTVQIVLSNLPAEYRLYVYGPDGSLSALSTESGLAERVVELSEAAPGRYGIFVDSPRGESSLAPYHLLATVTSAVAPAIDSPSPTGPVPLAPVIASPPAAGAVLFQDTFDSASARAMRTSSSSQYTVGYLDGEYQIRILDSAHDLIEGAYIPGSFADASIQVDVRVAGGPGFQTVILDCREQPGDDRRQYRFRVDLEARSFSLVLTNGADPERDLVPPQPSAAIRRGNEVNRLLLTCAGTTIVASINGVEVAAVEDGTYAAGRMWFGIGRSAAVSDLRFDNLVVTQAGLRPAVSSPRPAPGTVLLADTFADPANGWFPRASTEPAVYRQGHVDGEYQIRTLDPQDRYIRGVYVPGIYSDASLTVEVRALGDAARQTVILDCREQPSGDGQYRLFVDLAERSFRLSRRDSSSSTVDLVALQPTAALRPGNQVNRLELSCAGNAISASINGTRVATSQDAAYTRGQMWLGAGNAGLGELRFDNLAITQR